jgi:hypothetical protein
VAETVCPFAIVAPPAGAVSENADGAVESSTYVTGSLFDWALLSAAITF